MERTSARTVLTEIILPGADYERLEHIEIWPDLRESGLSRPDVGALVVNHNRVDEYLLQRFWSDGNNDT